MTITVWRKGAAFCALFLVIVLTACGGGSSSGSGSSSSGASTGTTVQGTAVGPGGTMAKAIPKGLIQRLASLLGFGDEAIAAAPLQAIVGANIFLFHIDDLGNPITPQGQSSPLILNPPPKTDTNGAFSVTLPAGTDLANNLIIQISTGTTPAKVGAFVNAYNHPVVRTALLINPATEMATELLIQKLPAQGHLTTTYNRDGIAAFIALLQNSAQNAGLTSVADLITQYQTNAGFQTQVNTFYTSNISQSNLALASGTYRYEQLRTRMDSSSQVRRSMSSGAVTLDSTSGTFSVSSQETGGELQESCTIPCGRLFTLSSRSKSNTLTGSYVVTADFNFVLTGNDGSFLVGYVNTGPNAGNIAIIPQTLDASSGELDVIVAIKKPSNLTMPAGSTIYKDAEFDSYLNAGQNSGNSWTGPLSSETGTSTFTLNSGQVSATGSGSRVIQTVNCVGVMNGCTVSATMAAAADDLSFPSTPFSLSPDGVVTVGGQVAAFVSADGNAILGQGAISPDETDFAILTKQASSLASDALDGTTWHVLVLSDRFSSDGSIMTTLINATASYNIGVQTFNGSGTSVTRREDCSQQPAGCTAIVVDTASFNDTRTVRLASDGTLALVSQNPSVGTINGYVSPDVSFGVTTNAVDNVTVNGVTFSTRTIGIAIKQS